VKLKISLVLAALAVAIAAVAAFTSPRKRRSPREQAAERRAERAEYAATAPRVGSRELAAEPRDFLSICDDGLPFVSR
jgi:hypothetical protein